MAHALHEHGRRVLLVDADPQGSTMRRQENADWPLAVIRLDSPKLHRTLPGVVGTAYDAVVIDTPPGDLAIVMSALRTATHVVVPMAPTSAEFERLPAVRELLSEAAALRPDGDEPIAAVLLTRTVAGAASTAVYRELVAEQGMRVLRTNIGRLERFSQALGAPVVRASAGAYGDALGELLAMAWAGAPVSRADEIRAREAARLGRRTAAPEEKQRSASPQVRAKAVRKTVDLPPQRYAALTEWCGESARTLGVARVTDQQVFNALVARLLTDETLARKIRDDLADDIARH